MTDDQTVTQADREAAWPYANFGHLPDSQERERWHDGYYDNQPVGAPIRDFAAHRTARSGEGRSNGAGEIDAGLVERFRSALRFAASHSVISSADEQELLAALAAPPASEAGMRVALEKAADRFEAINNFGDPYEIAENPEDFGGTDDGGETVCMAYENMQGIAAAGARECRAALAQPEGTKSD